MICEHIYTVEILGTGEAFAAAHATLDQYPHLPFPGSSYLVSGEQARDALLAHNGAGDVVVAASLTAPHEADEVMAPAGVIAAFIAHTLRDMEGEFRWDEEAHLWCISSNWKGNYFETDDVEALDEVSAAKAALAYSLIDQDEERFRVAEEVWP